MERPRRTHAQARAEMRAGILRGGNELLARYGAAGLSVREIARGLGVASSAIYRHVASRDELLTLLLVDAYEELAECVSKAMEAEAGGASGDGAVTADTASAAFASLARSMRGWAKRNPAKWALVYGSPVPGYAAPAEETTGPGTVVIAQFLVVLAAGERAAHAGGEGRGPQPSAEYRKVLVEGGEELGLDVSPCLAADALESWVGLVGLISAEVFEQLGSDMAEHGEEILERWIVTTAQRFGLE